MRHRITYNIEVLDSGFVLEVHRWYFNFWGHLKERTAWTTLEDLKKYLNNVIDGQIDLWGKK